MCIINIFNLTCKIAIEKLQKNIIAKINYNKKKSIKTIFNIQKIMQKNNILTYY